MPKVLPPVDDDVFEALQRLAVPLVDDVNSVLRRVLGLNGRAPSHIHTETEDREATPSHATAKRMSKTVARMPSQNAKRSTTRRRTSARSRKGASKAPRAARGTLLPESDYELPMLRALVQAGGRAPASEVIEAVGADLAGRLTSTDQETLRSGDVRWKNRTQFVRLKLVREGAMAKDAPRGVWEITELGRQRVNGAGA